MPINDSNSSHSVSINLDESNRSDNDNHDTLHGNSNISSVGDSFHAIKGQKSQMRKIIQSDSEDEPDLANPSKISPQKNIVPINSEGKPDLVNHRSRRVIWSDSEDEPEPVNVRRRNIIQSDSEDEPDLLNPQGRNVLQSEPEDEPVHIPHYSDAEQQNQHNSNKNEPVRNNDAEISISSIRSEAASRIDGEKESEICNLSDSVVEVEQEYGSFSPSMLRSRIQDLSIQDITSPEDKREKSDTENVNAIQIVRRSLEQKQSLLKSIKNLEALPDKGTKLKQQVAELEDKLSDLERNQTSSSQSEPKSTVPEESSSAKQEKEDHLRKQIQMKKVLANKVDIIVIYLIYFHDFTFSQWALGNATGEQRTRIRAELATAERELFNLVMSNSKTFQKYNAAVMNATNRHPAAQLLTEVPSMTDIQRRMFAEQPTDHQLYAKGICSIYL